MYDTVVDLGGGFVGSVLWMVSHYAGLPTQASGMRDYWLSRGLQDLGRDIRLLTSGHSARRRPWHPSVEGEGGFKVTTIPGPSTDPRGQHRTGFPRFSRSAWPPTSAGQQPAVDVTFTTTIAATTEAFVNPVAAQLAARGHCVQLITGDREPEADYAHTSAVLPMHRGMSPSADVNSLWRWVSHLRSTRPRMIVAGTPKASLLGLTAARIAGVPARVYVIHGAVWDGASGHRRRILEAADRAAIASSTHQLAVSDSLARLIYARGLSPRMPTVVGSGSLSGVDVQAFSPGDSTERSRTQMCFIGRLNRDKGVDVLIRTLDRVREQVDASLTVVGGIDTSAPPHPATLAALERHPHVNWVGEVSDVRPFLRQSSVLLFPTSREGLGQVVLEAQACGVPVVAWRVTGVIDAVRDGFTGILVPFGDEEGLAASAVTLLASPDLHREMASNGRRWVVDRFERGSVVKSNVGLLEKFILSNEPLHD